jgi:uncharacterized protein YhaN
VKKRQITLSEACRIARKIQIDADRRRKAFVKEDVQRPTKLPAVYATLERNIRRLKRQLAERLDELETLWKCHRVLLHTLERERGFSRDINSINKSWPRILADWKDIVAELKAENARLTSIVVAYKEQEQDRAMREIRRRQAAEIQRRDSQLTAEVREKYWREKGLISGGWQG